MKKEGFIHFSPDADESGSPFKNEDKKDIIVDQMSGDIIKTGNPSDIDAYLKAKKEYEGKEVSEKIEGGSNISGITEAHTHPAGYSTFEMMKAVPLFGVGSEKGILSKMKDASSERDPQKPIVAIGWDTSKVKKITKEEIEEVMEGKSGVICDASFHGGVVFGKVAEKLAELTNGQKLSGHFGKNGQVSEQFLIKALEVAESDYSVDQIVEGLEKRMDKYLGQGITAVHDMLPLTSNQFIAELILRKKWESERQIDFPIRKIFLSSSQLKEITSRLPELERSGLLTQEEIPQLLGLKLFADGSFGTHTAKLSESYSDIGGTGIFYDKVGQMNEAMKIAAEHGIDSVAMHAIGDKGIQRAIKTAKDWMKIADEKKVNPGKFRIEHFELPMPLESTLKETKDLGIWVTPQPNFLLDYVYKDRLGERTRLICPHQEIVNAGIPMMFGTDGMPDSMLYAIYLATHAENPKQRLSLTDALLAATLAASQYEGSNRGELKEGNKADIIVANPALLKQLTAGKPDVNQENTYQRIAELEGQIRKVYKNGVEVYNKK